MELLKQFISGNKASQFFSERDKLLLAVSGGIDSVVLCDLCKKAGYDFMIAHCNFRMRGEESERDERFVSALGNKYGVEVLVKKFDTEMYAAEKKLSIQVAARELRYDWFRQLTGPGGQAKYTLTAHHADDNAETVLMNFLRGTGLHGLAGMPAVAGYLRRPLLQFTRDQIRAFAKENELEFVEDSSNQSLKYTRNLFRNEIIPLIEKVYPQVKENLHDNIRRFKEIEQLYHFSTGELKKKLCRKKGREVHIPHRQLLSYQNRALIYAIISDYGFTERQVDEVLKLAGSDSGKYIQSPEGHYRIIKHRHWFIISPQKDPDAATIIIEEEDRIVLFAGGQLELEVLPMGKANISAAQNTGLLDRKEIAFPLLLRKWKQGDYFYPLGMKKKKKLSRFFIDQKLSKTEKEKVWVLEMNKKIIWVLGQRIDDRYKVTAHTKSVLQLTVRIAQ